MKEYTIMTLNPGSTSMKVAIYKERQEIFNTNFEIPADKLKSFPSLYDQYLYRKELVLQEVKAKGIDLHDVDAFVARSGGMTSCASGLYGVNDLLMGRNDIRGPHSAAQQMGCQFVKDLTAQFGGQAYVINDASVDEMQDVARVTGMRGLWRGCVCHALNQKAAAEMAAESCGKKVEDMNLIVAHLGGGVSIGAHKKGKLVDTTTLFGDAPMSPTRTGNLEIGPLLMMLLQQQTDPQKLMKIMLQNGGGLISQLGTSDCREVEKMIAMGDKRAELIYDGMIYQFAQGIARMAAAMKGKVDRIVLTGGCARSTYIQETLKEYCGWIAPIMVFGGEYETEAMVMAALKVLHGETAVNEYTDKPVFDASKYN